MTTSLRASDFALSTLEALRDAQVDVAGAVRVDIQTDIFAGKRRVWVNINGVCVLRVSQADDLKIVDLGPVQRRF